MATTPSSERERTLRPRIVDVTEMDYDTAVSQVGSEACAYFERKPGRTTLVIR